MLIIHVFNEMGLDEGEGLILRPKSWNGMGMG